MKVIVVEDQLLFLEFLVEFTGKVPGLEVVGTAADGPSALRVFRETKAKLVILDILIPKLSGIHVAREILAESPQTRILAISSETDIKTLYQVNQLQLAGFIDKNEASVTVLTTALEAVKENRRYFSESFLDGLRRLRADPNAFQKILSRREQEVLTYIGGGLSDEAIGKILGLSETSVQSHRKHLFRKLNVHTTPELIRFAHESGFWKAAFPRMDLTESYHLHQ